MKRNRALIVAAIAFLIAAGVGAAFIKQLQTRREENRRRAAMEAASARASAIEKQLDRASATAHAVAAVLQRQGSMAAFDSVAADLRNRYPLITQLGFASAPLADPEQNRDANQAARLRAILFGPPLSRGKEGLICYGYLPVFDSDQLRGFVIVAFQPAQILKVAGIDDLVKNGLDYSIARVDPGTGRSNLLARSTELTLRDPIRLSISVPGGNWELSAAPRNGWRAAATPAGEPAIVLVASLVVALFVYDLLRRPERLEREVELRAQRLVETNRKLMNEMTERERAEEQARHEATHDQLTGLANRPHFLMKLGRLLDRKTFERDFAYSVLLLNLDRFKNVNDTLGPPAGDQMLIDVARRLERAVRPEDMVARVGGDEFAVLLFDTSDVLDVTHVAQRAQDEIHRPFEIDGEQVFTSASIGIALSASGYDHAEDALRDAHLAMNSAKRDGGSRCVMFDRAMHERAINLSRIERDLRPALERNQLRVFYQAIVSLETGGVTGFEALIRWQHPERGFVSPGAFLPVAESTGLIVAMDRWVLGEASRHVRSLSENGRTPFSISVNLSGKQFSDPGLVAAVENSLNHSGLDPQQLRLEITESVMMENADAAFKTLTELKRLNVRISLDDFGTGYSSLSYIRQFPLDFLKIDRSFVSKMTENAKDEEIVRIIVVLAETLGLGVIAEGVETAKHLEALRGLRCAYGQGYLFSKPLDTETLGQFLATEPRW